MELKNPETQKLVNDLTNAGILDPNDGELLEYLERTQGEEFSVDEVIERYLDNVDRFSLRPSEVDTFKAIAVANGVSESKVVAPPATEEETDERWWSASALGITPEEIGEEIEIWKDRVPDIGSLFQGVKDATQAAGEWVHYELIDPTAERPPEGQSDVLTPDQAKVKTARMRETIRMIEMISGRSVTMDDLNWEAKGYESFNEMLEKEYDFSRRDMAEIMQSSVNAGFKATNRSLELDARLEEQQAQVDELLTDNEKLQSRKAFEVLNDEYPGRYVYNSENGQIYQVGADGGLVDQKGNLLRDVYERTGELPEGYEAEDLLWDEASLQQAPWEQAGTDVDTYYSLYDIVENPHRYHTGGVERFVSGEQFIGGFASDYGVAQSQELQRQIREDRMGPEAGRAAIRRGMGEYAWESWTQDIQEVRRPWYDQGDNWALYAGRSPEAIAQEQDRLIAMGALDEGDVVRGSWGMAEARVMERMMTVANGRAEKIEDISMDDWKTLWSDASSGGAASRRAFVAPTYQKLDPARAQLTIEDTVRRMLGRDATEDELADLGVHMADMHRQSFVADVQALRQEYNAETRAIETEAPQSGGEVQDVDWEARFQQQFNERNEAELARFDRTQDRMQRQQIVGGAMNSFMQQLGGGIGGGSLGGR